MESCSIKKVTVSCNIDGTVQPFTFYLGTPAKGAHPLENQADWFGRERFGTIPQGVMDSIKRLYDVAEANDTTFAEICEELKREHQGG